MHARSQSDRLPDHSLSLACCGSVTAALGSEYAHHHSDGLPRRLHLRDKAMTGGHPTPLSRMLERAARLSASSGERRIVDVPTSTASKECRGISRVERRTGS